MNTRKDRQLDQIANLITELACGDYDKRINTTNFKDKNLLIAALLNMLAGHLKNIFKNLSAYSAPINFELLFFLFDEDLNVTNWNSISGNYIKSESLNNLNSFLTRSSVNKIKKLFNSDKSEISLDLKYKFKDELIVSLDSRISCLSRENKIYIMSAIRNIPIKELHISRNKKLNRRVANKFDIWKNKKIIDRVYHYLMNNLDKPFPSIEFLAKKVNANPSLLKRGFPLLYGSTMAQFHLEKRMEKAKDLLKASDTTQIIIAERCGFISDAHFSRTFKKFYGITPSKCR
ncbi:AraC-like DNA-binding protein [Salegentibacter sp. 24]|uniref:helix-turn-helix domain-containing protein n=1 Tax=Salegentibacter sp. 24 TaxID=2183986 RepID=UPI00105BF864|nr:AraC family transcriptional regulator [Salegentibacter sp. 24]TDN94966.1 AraC-like DNA-binding protein [Salegentibacter sp. 24]